MCCALMSPSEQFSQICCPASPRSVAAWKQADGSAAGWAWHHTGTDSGQRIQVAIQPQFKVSDLNKTSDWLSWAELWTQDGARMWANCHPYIPPLSVTSPPRPAPRLAAATYNLLCQYFGGNLGWIVEYRADTALDSTGAGLTCLGGQRVWRREAMLHSESTQTSD